MLIIRDAVCNSWGVATIGANYEVSNSNIVFLFLCEHLKCWSLSNRHLSLWPWFHSVCLLTLLLYWQSTVLTVLMEKVATLKVWWGLRQRVCVCVSKRDGKWNETGRFPLDRTHWKGHQLCSLFITQWYHPSLTLLLQLTLFLNMFFPVGSINIWRPHYLLPLFNLVVLSYCFHLLSSTAPSVSYIKDWMFFECTFSLIF